MSFLATKVVNCVRQTTVLHRMIVFSTTVSPSSMVQGDSLVGGGDFW